MDRQEDSGVTLGLVQVPRTEPDTTIDVSEMIDQIVSEFGAKLPVDARRQFELKMEAVRSEAGKKDYDIVTGLLTRRAAWNQFVRIVGRARRDEIGLIFADIDSFKDFNSEFGRLGGDQVLQAIGVILQEDAREEDILIARFGDGADEFMAIVRDTTAVDFRRMVHRLSSKLNSIKEQRRVGYQLGRAIQVSVGCALVSWSSNRRDRRQYANVICRKLYQRVSAAADEGKAERKLAASRDRGPALMIPMLQLVVRLSEVLETETTYITNLEEE